MKNEQRKYAKKWFSSENERRRFALVPCEMLLDKRLKPRHRNVLVALMLHANAASGECELSREAIADYADLAVDVISRTTSELRDFGWLLKKQTDIDAPNKYTLLLPSFSEEDIRTPVTRRRTRDEQRAVDEAREEKRKQLSHKSHSVSSTARDNVDIDRIAEQMEELKNISNKERNRPYTPIPEQGVGELDSIYHSTLKAAGNSYEYGDSEDVLKFHRARNFLSDAECIVGWEDIC